MQKIRMFVSLRFFHITILSEFWPWPLCLCLQSIGLYKDICFGSLLNILFYNFNSVFAVMLHGLTGVSDEILWRLSCLDMPEFSVYSC